MFIDLNLAPFGLSRIPFQINDADQGLSAALKRDHLREPINSKFLVKTLARLNPKKDLVVDIGGNIGYFPVIEALAFKGEIRVYEPVKSNFEILQTNAAYRNVSLFNLAVGDRAGSVYMNITDRLNNCAITDNTEYNRLNNIRIVDRQTVNMVSLSAALDSRKKAFIRCDIEGYETEILKTIPDNLTGISLEFHTAILGVKRSLKFIEDLAAAGFTVDIMTRELDGLSLLINKYGYFPVKVYNLLKEKRIYEDPKKREVERIIRLKKENPHLFLSR